MRSILLVTLLLVGLGTVAGCGSARPCADVEVVFARGTTEPPGLGVVGEPFARAVAARLPGRSVATYAVDYPADYQLATGVGATDVTRHVTAVAADCPGTRFVLGGWSQGGIVVSQALGVPVPRRPAEVLPPALAPRVAAVVAFGNALYYRAVASIETSPTPFRAQSREFCNLRDPWCGGRGPGTGDHDSYPRDGSTDAGAEFAAARVQTP